MTDTRRGGLVGKLSNTGGDVMSVPTCIELPIASCSRFRNLIDEYKASQQVSRVRRQYTKSSPVCASESQ